MWIYLETGMIIFSNLSETCSLVFNDFAATSASRLDEKGPAITWNPFFFPGVRRMKPSLLCFLTLSSIFSALRKLGKVPTKRPYFLSSFRGAIGCSFAAGRLMAVFGGFVSEVPTPSLGGGGCSSGGAIGAVKGGGVLGASEPPGNVCCFSSNLPVGTGAGLLP